MEGNVEKFKSANKVTSLSNDAQKYLESSQQVDQQKAQIQTQLNIIEALEQNLQLNKSNPKIIPSTYGVQDQLLNKLVERYNELVLENEKLQQVSGPKNPLVIELLDQINELRGKLSTSVDNLKRAYSISLNDIAFKDDQLSNQIRNVPLLEKRLIQITRSQNVQENLYAYLLQKREEAAVAKASTVEDFQIIVNARELGMVAPNKNIILTVGILAGLLLPVFFATARDLLNNKIGDAYQIEQSTSFPIIGTISHVRKLTTPIVVDNQLRSVAADQIRNLRTSIYLLNQRKAIKTMMLTSYQSGDGKSFVSLNLAASYALLDKKTVMIEFDLRCPDISKKYGLEDNLGISDVLSGSTSIQDVLVVVPEFNSNLFILPAGNAVMNPTELLSGSEMHKLMHTLQKQFDYIIIDTPPINLFADYSLLQQFSDVTLVVLRQDYTSRDVYNELRHLETKYPNDLIYLVLNDTGKRKKYRDPYSSYKNKLAKKYYSKISGNL
jgi:capsular exopolysaccharide synthesis family protein